MAIAGNQDRLSVQVSQAAGWHNYYTRGLAISAPALVLDFERGFYGTGALSPDHSGLLALTRASTKTVTGADGLPYVAAVDEAAFDHASGRRGLHLSWGPGADEPDYASVSLGSWWSTGAGTLVVDCRMVAAQGGFDRFIEVNDTSASNRYSVYYNSSQARAGGTVQSGGASQAALLGASTAYTPDTDVRFALSFDTNDFALCLDGGTVLTDTTGVLPVGLSRMDLASSSTGHRTETVIYQVVYYDQALSDSDMITLTT